MRNAYFIILFCFVPILLILFQNAQGDNKPLSEDQTKIMQEKFQKAMRELKQEIKITVDVENPGTISGTVKCRRVRHSGDTVVYIEKVGDNKYDPPEEHGVIDQINLIFIPHVIAIQRGTTVDFPNSDL